MKIIGAAPGSSTEYAPHGAAEFRFVSGGLQLEFLHGFDPQLLVVQPVVHAGGIDTVHVKDVLRAGGAVDRDSLDTLSSIGHVSRQGFGIDARSEAGVVGEVSSAGGVGQPLTRINRGCLALEGIDCGRARLHHDGAFDTADLEDHRDRVTPPDLDDDFFLH